MPLEIKCVLEHEAILPSRKTPDSAGYDLYSTSEILLPPNKHVMVTTGVHLAIPEGYYAQILGKSSLALKYGVNPLGGVIDSGYIHEIVVILMNLGRFNYKINIGDPIAQFIVLPCPSVNFVLVSELDYTDRSNDPPLTMN